MKLFDDIIQSPSFNPNAQTDHDGTPLMFALSRLSLKTGEFSDDYIMYTVQSLLEVPGIDINATHVGKDKLSMDALGYAIMAGVPYVELLVGRGADVLIPDAFDLAKEKGAPGVYEFLQSGSYKSIAGNATRSGGVQMPPGIYKGKEVEEGLRLRIAKFEKEKEELKKCAQCKKPSTSSCSLCHKAKYCSKECQTLHWPTHKAEVHLPKQCAICLDLVQDGRQEYCGHQYHKKCIDPWKEKKEKPLCPTCNEPLKEK